MQYLLVAYDGEDDQALQRRLVARDAHIALGDELLREGRMHYGTAILSDAGAMIGSMLVLEFPTQQELDAYMAIEPYVLGNVWQDVKIRPCRVGPSFVGLHL